jgi:Ca2+-binding EF-hand superfamily protein
MSEYPQELLLENAKSSGDPLTLLGEAGFAAKLCNLEGTLGKYVGTFVRPKLIKPGQYEVGVTDPNGKKMLIVIPGKSLEVVVDFETLEELASSDQSKKSSGNHFSGNNRGNVKITIDNLCMEIRKAIKKAVKVKGADGKTTTVQEIFGRFDENGNGVLDSREFLNGCVMLKVNIAKEEVDLVWPVLTMGKGGEIGVERFLKFVESSTVGGRRASGSKEAGRTREVLMMQAQQQGRAARIRRASVSVGVRETVKAYCMKEKISATEMFSKLDDDGTGLISKSELVSALKKLKFKVEMQDMEDIWPLLNADGGMQITAKEWDAFIEGRQTAGPPKAGGQRRSVAGGGRRTSAGGGSAHVNAVRKLSQAAVKDAARAKTIHETTSSIALPGSENRRGSAAGRRTSNAGSMPDVKNAASAAVKRMSTAGQIPAGGRRASAAKS